MAAKKAKVGAQKAAKRRRVQVGDVIRADMLISEASTVKNQPSQEALVELDKIVNYNRTASPRARVRVVKAIELLASYGWVRERSAFERLVRSRYGHGWSGK